MEPKDGRIFMIGMKTNKGFHRVIECHDDESEKEGIVEFFKVIDQLRPSIIGSYNGFNFDWFWIFERCKMLNLDIKRIKPSLYYKNTSPFFKNKSHQKSIGSPLN